MSELLRSSVSEPDFGSGGCGGSGSAARNRDRRRGNGLRLGQGRLRVGIRKNFFTEGIAGIGTGCPGR